MIDDCTILTIGHATRSLEELTALLAASDIDLLVDVRSVPRSRRNPQFNADTLPVALREAGVEYYRLPALGGWRRPHPDSPNTGWRLESFRGFADHMLSAEFELALADLIARASGNRKVAIMCAETVPWRCHRSLIADALTARGCEVRHIIGPGAVYLHRMTPFAKVGDGKVTYPPDSSATKDADSRAQAT